MTRDELLSSIIDYGENGPIDYGQIDLSKALRAVVELHKPEWALLKIILPGTKPDPVAICSHCSDDQWRKSYPCDTIQAIEKELE